MLEKLSNLIAVEINKHSPTSNIEIMKYELGIWLNYITGAITTIALGVITGHLFGACLSYISFVIIRKFSGGVHMESLTWCAICSALLFTIIALININDNVVLMITFITLFLYLLYAPNDFEELIASTKKTNYFKMISVIIVSMNFLISSSVLALTFLLQALLILPVWNYMKGGRTIE